MPPSFRIPRANGGPGRSSLTRTKLLRGKSILPRTWETENERKQLLCNTAHPSLRSRVSRAGAAPAAIPARGPAEPPPLRPDAAPGPRVRPAWGPPPSSPRNTLSEGEREIKIRGGGGGGKGGQSLAEVGDWRARAHTSPAGDIPPLPPPPSRTSRAAPHRARGRAGPGLPRGGAGRAAGSSSRGLPPPAAPRRPSASDGSRPRGRRSGPAAPVPGQTWLGPVACGRLGWAAAGAPLLSLPAAQTQAAARAGFPVRLSSLPARPDAARRGPPAGSSPAAPGARGRHRLRPPPPAPQTPRRRFPGLAPTGPAPGGGGERQPGRGGDRPPLSPGPAARPGLCERRRRPRARLQKGT